MEFGLGIGNSSYSSAISKIKDGGLAYATVLETNSAQRTYTIRTRSINLALHDITASGVQQMSAFTSVHGDEDSCMVEPGTMGICCFIGDTPYILGFFNPVQTARADAATDKTLGGGKGNDGSAPGSAVGRRDSIDPGDKIIQTRGRCKIVWRRSGIIEIESSPTCKRVFYPSTDRISDTCRDYELTADGMAISNSTIKSGNIKYRTYYRAAYKDNLAAKNMVIIERGSVSPDDATLIEKVSMGAYTSGQKSIVAPIYVKFTKNTGKVEECLYPKGNSPDADSSLWYRGVSDDGTIEETVNNRAYSKKISPDGSVDISAGNSNFTATINPLGNIAIETQGTINVKGQYGSYVDMSSGKVKIGNAFVELVDTVYQICQELSTTVTASPGSPLSSAPLFAKLALQIAMLKG